MFSTKGQEVKTGNSVDKSFNPGVVYAHIYSGQVKTSSKKDKKVLELVLEGPELPNFEGWSVDRNNPDSPKFTGLSAIVTATIWTDQFNETNVMKNEILQKLTVIATELGLRDAVDNISAVSLEDWVAQAIDILKGHDMYWFLKGSEEEYNGKTKVRLSLPRYKFCSVNESRLDKFDKNNPYHYKALQTKTVTSFEPVNDEFDI